MSKVHRANKNSSQWPDDIKLAYNLKNKINMNDSILTWINCLERIQLLLTEVFQLISVEEMIETTIRILQSLLHVQLTKEC